MPPDKAHGGSLQSGAYTQGKNKEQKFTVKATSSHIIFCCKNFKYQFTEE